MKKHILSMLALLSIMMFTACDNNNQKYIIGVSQCSEDSWRAKLQQEFDMATYFNEDVELRYASAHDDSKLQQQQIDSLINSGIQLLIVSPNQIDNLAGPISRAYDRGIPVILYDRKTSSNKYTTFMGADNYLIGEMLAQYLVGKLKGKGNVVEIGGLKGSSPAEERHNGFVNVLKNHPDIHLVAYQSGDWTEASGEMAMRRILKDYSGPIDAIYGGNDRMAVGAHRVMKEKGLDNPNMVYLGVDALPTPNGGIQQVSDSLLTATAIYPTHGDEVLELAIRILNGEDVPKEITMQSSVVTNDNARVLQLQHQEVIRQAEYLKKMHSKSNILHDSIRTQRNVIGIILLMALITAVMLGFTVRNSRIKHSLNEKLGERNAELNAQQEKLREANTQLHNANTQLHDLNSQLQTEKEIAERQRDELEEQRDKLIEMSLRPSRQSSEGEGDEILSGNEQQYRHESEFMNKFTAAIEDQLSNSDLSVEDIGSVMCLSRVQLYRKVKALTGKSPVEIIRETRLQRAHHLLADSSLNISEIAYRVGFSSPSYFTKCYKDMFGKAPTDVQKVHMA